MECKPSGFKDLFKKALFCRCPNCGKGKLFRGYIKQVDKCSECGEELGQIRADDGPPWLTIVIVGHIIAPLMLVLIPDSQWSMTGHMIFWPVLSLILMLITLPFSKALFIGIIWRTKCLGAGSNE